MSLSNEPIMGILNSLINVIKLVDTVDEDRLDDRQKVLVISKMLWIQGIAEREDKEIKKLFPTTSPQVAVEILVKDFEDFINALPKKDK